MSKKLKLSVLKRGILLGVSALNNMQLAPPSEELDAKKEDTAEKIAELHGLLVAEAFRRIGAITAEEVLATVLKSKDGVIMDNKKFKITVGINEELGIDVTTDYIGSNVVMKMSMVTQDPELHMSRAVNSMDHGYTA